MGSPPSCFNWGFNTVPNVNDAWNLTSRGWSKVNVDKSYCNCGVIDKPPRIRFDREENGVYLARVIQCTFCNALILPSLHKM